VSHVIWDWNGTLLDDLSAIIEAVNEALCSQGAQAIEPEQYRDHYTRPVKRFYERLLSRSLSDRDWAHLDESFHDAYRSRMAAAPLAADAMQALAHVQALGATQSLLSMLRHQELMRALEGRGVREFMLHVEGLTGTAGDGKARHLLRHVELLCGARGDLTPADCLVIGDSLDDARAAAEVGLRCVLYDSGTHHRHELERVGVPVADGLLQALAMAGIGQ